MPTRMLIKQIWLYKIQPPSSLCMTCLPPTQIPPPCPFETLNPHTKNFPIHETTHNTHTHISTITTPKLHNIKVIPFWFWWCAMAATRWWLRRHSVKVM